MNPSKRARDQDDELNRVLSESKVSIKYYHAPNDVGN